MNENEIDYLALGLLHRRNYLRIVNDFSNNKPLYCYYSNLESLMANWDNLVEFKPE